jgi:hypothetical protein
MTARPIFPPLAALARKPTIIFVKPMETSIINETLL